VDGKGSSSPISGLRASSIDLETHLAGRSAETRRARQHRTEERYYLCQAIFQYRSATLAAVRIAGERMYLWRAVDDEGEVLDMLVQRRRDSRSALRLIRKLLKKQGFVPKLLVTDKLRSYAAAFRRLRLTLSA
jgi:transposase-like protein